MLDAQRQAAQMAVQDPRDRLARFGQGFIPKPGGDKIGRRRVDTHFLGFEKLGAKFSYDAKEEFYRVTADELAERGVAPNPAEHLANGAFSVMPPDDVTDYMEAQWAEMTAGG